MEKKNHYNNDFGPHRHNVEQNKLDVEEYMQQDSIYTKLRCR